MDDLLWPKCFLESSSTVWKKKFYLYTSHIENVSTSKSGIFLDNLYEPEAIYCGEHLELLKVFVAALLFMIEFCGFDSQILLAV